MQQASPDNSEWLTRKKLIDGRLKAADWKIARFDASAPLSKFDRYAVEEFETANGPAEYALVVGGSGVVIAGHTVSGRT